MPAIRLTIKRTKMIRKAVITAAGIGTRLFPMTKIIRKELMPVFDSEGNLKPLILANVEEAISAGIEQICIIIQEKERCLFENFFKNAVPVDVFNKLNKESQEYARHLETIGEALTFIPQTDQKGLAHALYTAKDWLNGEPFLLILGDHSFSSLTELTCAHQLIAEYEKTEQITIGREPTPLSEAYRFGCVGGEWEADRKLLVITLFYEKPDPDYVRQYLLVNGIGSDTVLTVFGQYILKPAIFDHIKRLSDENKCERGEIQLTTALDALSQSTPVKGLVMEGKKIDIGVPEGYEKAMMAAILRSREITNG